MAKLSAGATWGRGSIVAALRLSGGAAASARAEDGPAWAGPSGWHRALEAGRLGLLSSQLTARRVMRLTRRPLRRRPPNPKLGPELAFEARVRSA